MRVLKHNGGGSAYGFGARVVDSVAEFVVGVVYAGAVKYALHAWQGNGCEYAKDGDDHKQLDDGKAAAGRVCPCVCSAAALALLAVAKRAWVCASCPLLEHVFLL